MTEPIPEKSRTINVIMERHTVFSDLWMIITGCLMGMGERLDLQTERIGTAEIQ